MQAGGPHTQNHLLCHDYRFCEHLQLGSFELHVTGACLCYKAHPPNKGCVIRDTTMHLTDEYARNSEVCLTSGLYGYVYFVW